MNGPINPDNPQAWQRFVELWTARRERPYAREVAASINRFAREAAAGIEGGYGPFNGPLASGGHRAEIERIMARRTETIAHDYSKLVRNNAKSTFNHEHKDFETEFQEWLRRWILTRTALNVTRVSDTTRQQIREAIELGQREEMGSAAIARTIRERTRIIGAQRALTIARTETGMITSAANETSLDALGIERRKKWVASASERTRDTHREADGQERGVDEAFQVGGATLMRPLDPDGPPGEIINCRCVSVALV
jgi:uncharacterized protein with gpF-like domain